jgi:hypothetical protein
MSLILRGLIFTSVTNKGMGMEHGRKEGEKQKNVLDSSSRIQRVYRIMKI